MDSVIWFALVPVFVWLWRKEIVGLVSDCIAEGIRKARTTEPKQGGE